MIVHSLYLGFLHLKGKVRKHASFVRDGIEVKSISRIICIIQIVTLAHEYEKMWY